MFRLDTLGDLVLTTPVFRELKRAYPKAHMTVVVQQAHRSILETNPYVDELLSVSSVRNRRRLKPVRYLLGALTVLLAQTPRPPLRRRDLSPLGYGRASCDLALHVDESGAARRLQRANLSRVRDASTEGSTGHSISVWIRGRCDTRLRATSPLSTRSAKASMTPRPKSP